MNWSFIISPILYMFFSLLEHHERGQSIPFEEPTEDELKQLYERK